MEALAKILDGITSTSLSTLPSISRTLDRTIFDKGIAWLEAAKQENFPPETLEVWYVEMNRLGWSDTTFRERVLNVLRAKTYGKVKFDDFVSAEEEPVYGRTVTRPLSEQFYFCEKCKANHRASEICPKEME